MTKPDAATAEVEIRVWLDSVGSRTERVEVLSGGEDDWAPELRNWLATLDVPDSWERLRTWTTSGEFHGDICRCPGGHYASAA